MTDGFECLIVDADCPSMTVRFRVPEDFPLAGGVYRIERIRSANADDTNRWVGFSEPPQLADGKARS